MIAIYQGQSMISRLIQFRTWSKDSHVSWIEPGSMTEYEAWAPCGVQKVQFGANHTDKTRVECFEVKLTIGEHEGLIEFLESQLGKKYDYAGILGFVVRRPYQDINKLFCSEYIFAAFVHIKRPLLARIEPWKVPPCYIRLSPLLNFTCMRFTQRPEKTKEKSVTADERRLTQMEGILT